MFLAVSTYCQLCRGRMAETSALFSLFAWFLEGFVLTACKKKMLCQVSTLRVLSIWRKLHFNYTILSYAGSEITFIRQAPTGDWNIFMVTRWKMWSPNSVKKFFLHGKRQKRKVFKTIFAWKYSYSGTIARFRIKMSCSWNGVFVK